MRAAFLFPGQGAQAPGMGMELYAQFDEVRAAVEAASEAAGIRMTDLYADAEGTYQKSTRWVQPALVSLEIAGARLLMDKYGIVPEAMAGLSLGEYAALACAGALTDADAVALVTKRGELMDDCANATGGAMMAVLGLEREKVQEACRRAKNKGGEASEAFPCNYNCPGQIVISGESAAVDEAGRIATELGAKRAMRLNVAGAFHSPYMARAAEGFQPFLSEAVLREPKVPVYSNVTAQPHAGDMKDLLVRQITAPVLWEDTLLAMQAAGIDTFIEVGPGRTLSGFVKKTLEGVTICNVEDAASLEKTLKTLGVQA